MEQHYCYIVECNDGTLYTGYTNNLQKRIETHNKGKGAKYTKTRLPVKLRYFETFESKREAMKREWYIKHNFSRQDKLALIRGFNNEDKV